MRKRWIALALTVIMSVSLAACGAKDSAGTGAGEAAEESSESAAEVEAEVEAEEVVGEEFYGKSTDFSYMLALGLAAPVVDKYEDLPAMQYVLTKEWDPDGNGNTRKIGLDILTPPGGTESDFANTLISTGDYADVMNITMASVTAGEMYEDGMSLDITDYVLQYMPNYLSWFDRHPEYKGRETTVVDGKRRYLCIYQLDETAPEPWGGMMYRRDWIVKYGTNPETGEAFSGSWDEEGNWVDDVVFPSGNSDPITITDWEWMLGLFQTALDDLGVTDGYAYSANGTGDNGVIGDMSSGFGAGAMWYIDPDTGKVICGAITDGFRTYLQAMREWYKNGWTNPAFYEHASDMFFMVDMGSVYAGKVGAWYGLTSQLGGNLDPKDGDEKNPLNGIVVFAAPTPINDKYGEEQYQNVEPFIYYATGLMGAQIVVTDKAEDKDLPALFTMLDYFYGPEGSCILTNGLSGEQVEECKTVAPEAAKMYTDWGLENGAYSVTEEGKILADPIVKTNDEIGGSTAPGRFNGLTNRTNIDNGYLPYYQHMMDLYRMYPNDCQIGGELTAQLTNEESSFNADVLNEYTTYTSRVIPEFITGEKDIYDDAQWQEFVDTLVEAGVNEYADNYNAHLE